jgi:hypothetical protein
MTAAREEIQNLAAEDAEDTEEKHKIFRGLNRGFNHSLCTQPVFPSRVLFLVSDFPSCPPRPLW